MSRPPLLAIRRENSPGASGIGALEHQVFEEVREAGLAWLLVHCADAVVDEVGDGRPATILDHHELQPVVQDEAGRIEDFGVGRRGGEAGRSQQQRSQGRTRGAHRQRHQNSLMPLKPVETRSMRISGVSPLVTGSPSAWFSLMRFCSCAGSTRTPGGFSVRQNISRSTKVRGSAASSLASSSTCWRIVGVDVRGVETGQQGLLAAAAHGARRRDLPAAEGIVTDLADRPFAPPGDEAVAGGRGRRLACGVGACAGAAVLAGPIAQQQAARLIALLLLPDADGALLRRPQIVVGRQAERRVPDHGELVRRLLRKPEVVLQPAARASGQPQGGDGQDTTEYAHQVHSFPPQDSFAPDLVDARRGHKESITINPTPNVMHISATLKTGQAQSR